MKIVEYGLGKKSIFRRDPTIDVITSQMEEGLAVRFKDEELRQAGKSFVNSLVVKLMGNRGFNRMASKMVLRDLWKPEEGMKFYEVEFNVMIVSFIRESDRDRVL